MRVLVDGLLLGGRPTGVEQAIDGLCTALPEAASRHEVTCLGRRAFTRTVTAALWQSAPGWVRGRLTRILYEQACLTAQWQARCDLLHAPGYILPGNWRKPSVLTVYDLIALDYPQYCTRLNALHYGWALPRSIRQATALVVPTQAVAEALGRRFPDCAAKTRVIPLGLDPIYQPHSAEEVEELRARLHLPEHYLLCVGNLEPKKNLEAVIDAYGMIADEFPHDLLIAGKPGWGWEPILRAFARSRHQSRMHLLDYVPHENLPALYSAADLLIQWSLVEGMGLPPLEAMASGCPAVVSDAPALVETAGPAGEVVPLGPPEVLAVALRRLLGDAERRRELRRLGIEHAQAFTWQRHVQAVVQLYEANCQ